MVVPKSVQCPPPFPWFGGKSRAAQLIWSQLGQVDSYLEPFAGSLGALLNSPYGPAKVETVNDLDGFLANFWRTLQKEPRALAARAQKPINEVDLHARHIWLHEHRADLTAHLMGDPFFYDLEVAAWWFWGLCLWIGHGWCSVARGPWVSRKGRLVKDNQSSGIGVSKQIPMLNNGGVGVHRVTLTKEKLLQEFALLSRRLERVRVVCGNWDRILKDSTIWPKMGGIKTAGILFDPPYQADLHTVEYVGEKNVGAEVRAWCKEHEGVEDLKIVLCGYEGEHDELGWKCIPWKSSGGYGGGGKHRAAENCSKERIWVSPSCSSTSGGNDLSLFE